MYLTLQRLMVHVQVNKPYLPLASGEYSTATGIALVTTFAAVVCFQTTFFGLVLFVIDNCNSELSLDRASSAF